MSGLPQGFPRTPENFIRASSILLSPPANIWCIFAHESFWYPRCWFRITAQGATTSSQRPLNS